MGDRVRTLNDSAPAIPHVPITEALGQSEAFLDFKERLSRVAKVDRPVLLVGERGTGKELAVSKLHYLSGRWHSRAETPTRIPDCAERSRGLLAAAGLGARKVPDHETEHRKDQHENDP